MDVKLLIFVLFLQFVPVVYAGEPPTLVSPSNNSYVSSSTLNWQAPSYPVCLTYSSYRVQVDDDPSFPISSIYRNSYTKNTYYTPQLPLGIWYWRVMARDETCNNWSDWSSIWSFTLSTAVSSSTPTPTPTSIHTPPPTSSTTSSPSSTSFIISNTPSQINSDQSFDVTVNLSLPNNHSTNFYLKGAFKKSDSSNYFGLTNVSANWVKNGTSYSSQYQITTDPSGNWSGNIEVKPDTEDSGFTGTDNYVFKVGRYKSEGVGPTWSNETTIKIVSVTSSEGGTPSTEDSSPSIKSYSPTPSPKKTAKQVSEKSIREPDYQIATIAAATSSATQEATSETEVKSQKQTNYISWVGILIVITGIGVFAYVYLRNSTLREAIFNLFRKRN